MVWSLAYYVPKDSIKVEEQDISTNFSWTFSCYIIKTNYVSLNKSPVVKRNLLSRHSHETSDVIDGKHQFGQLVSSLFFVYLTML
jgi:hypothetical protein